MGDQVNRIQDHVPLQVDEIRDVLVEHGRLAAGEAISVEPLGGGVSSDVVLVTSAGREPIVVKRARDRLNVSADWRIDRNRALNEATCLTYLGQVLPPGSVPAVRFVDERRFLFGMEAAPGPRVTWKQQLLRGEVSNDTAKRVGALLGQIHRAGALPSLAAQFDRSDIFEQGRIDPFHRMVACRHPALASAINLEIVRMQGTKLTLALGDVSPKNMFVYPNHVSFFDVEIAHWGDPAFDVAFCLTQLTLKAIVFEGYRAALVGAAEAFLASYKEIAPAWPRLDRSILAELGCLLLARIDGKSPAEYVTRAVDKNTVRRLAEPLLLAPPATIPELLDGLSETSLAKVISG